MANRLSEYTRDPLPFASARTPSQTSPALQDRMNSLLKQTTQWIVANPEVALTTAVVTGVVLGWFIKRR